MADATIKRILPALNTQPGKEMHYNFAIEGTNLSNATNVTVTFGNTTWNADEKQPHGADGKLLLIKVSPPVQHKSEKLTILQIEDLMVTVSNGMQDPSGPPIGTIAVNPRDTLLYSYTPP